MDPFVRRLIERLHHPSAPLSRNRHFATFETPEGRAALRASRRLKSIQKDILLCKSEGGRAVVAGDRDQRIELTLVRVRGRRVCHLDGAEFELLQKLPGVSQALERVPGSASAAGLG
jgi:hypothetical protein